MTQSILKQIKIDLIESENPVARILHHNTHFKTLFIAFKNGMIMKEHKANWPSKLTVIEGCVTFSYENEDILLQEYDEFDIDVNRLHTVFANKDSLCILTQSKP